MKSIFSFIPFAAVLIASLAHGEDAGPFYLKDGDKVVFYGDSITEQRLYTTFTEMFVLTRFPKLKVDFVHSGWGGDRVGGGGGGPIDLRLDRDVFAYKPTVVTIMLGMNDGSYHAADQGTTDTYEKGYRHIVDSLQTKLPGVRITMIQPSPHDDITRPPDFAGGGYNAVLQSFSQFVKDLAAKNKQNTADFNTPVVDMLTKANATDPNDARNIIGDRVHPGPAGHLIMAEALVKSWNMPGTVSDVEIDAAAAKVVHAENSKVDNLKAGGTVTWIETDNSLPMPTRTDSNEANNKNIDLAMSSSDFFDAINREPLKVTGLKAPYYELAIDDSSVGVFSKDDLAKGVNLAKLSTPMMDQANVVMGLTTQHNNMHFERWRVYQVPLESKNNPVITNALPPILAELDAEEAKVVDQQRAAAQPMPNHYVLTPQQDPGVITDASGAPVDPVLPKGLGPNLALNKKYESTDPNGFGWNSGLTDGSYSPGNGTTYATGNGGAFPKSVTIDLEKPEKVSNVLVANPPFGSTKRVEVSVSTDNATFTPVGHYSFPQGIAVKHLFTFDPTSARYVRLTFPNHHSKSVQFDPNYIFITEVEAYGPAAK